MKLRALLVLLVLANLGFFAWTQGWLDGVVGVPARGDREPERLARQFQPDAVRILHPARPAASAPTAAPAAVSCLEAGPFGAAEASAAESLLQAALPAGSWLRRESEQPGAWLVYLGRFSVKEALQGKAAELRRVQMPFEEVDSPPELAPGLSVGRFDNHAAAEQALEELSRRGVRGARIVTLAEPVTLATLRIERTNAALSAKLGALTGEVNGQPLGKAFVACAR